MQTGSLDVTPKQQTAETGGTNMEVVPKPILMAETQEKAMSNSEPVNDIVLTHY